MSKSKTEIVMDHLASIGHEPSPQEVEQIAKNVGCSKALVYKVLRKMPKPAESIIPSPVEPVVRIEEQEAIEVPAIEEVTKPAEEKVPPEFERKAIPIEEIEAKLEVGMLNEDDLTYIWQAVNDLFPDKHKRPDKSMRILGKLWVKPANRLIEKYGTENVDLYLAMGATVLTFAPSIIGMVKERREKPKKEFQPTGEVSSTP